jgi:hypothetical protein
MKTVLILMGCLVLLAGVTLAALPWVVVDVRQAEPEAFHATVPLPLPLARAALLFVDEDEARVEIPELARFLAGAEKMVRLLIDAPDAELPRISGRDEEVIVATVGNDLVIGVETRGKEVHVRAPLSRLEELLSYYDGEAFEVSGLLDAVGAISPGEIVQVRGREPEVTVAIR